VRQLGQLPDLIHQLRRAMRSGQGFVFQGRCTTFVVTDDSAHCARAETAYSPESGVQTVAEKVVVLGSASRDCE